MFSAFRMGPATSERRLCDRTSRVRTSHFPQVNTYTINITLPRPLATGPIRKAET